MFGYKPDRGQWKSGSDVATLISLLEGLDRDRLELCHLLIHVLQNGVSQLVVRKLKVGSRFADGIVDSKGGKWHMKLIKMYKPNPMFMHA